MARQRGRPRQGVRLDPGLEGLVARMFELAWRDLDRDDHRAVEAERFLLDPVTVDNVEFLGGNADFYVSLARSRRRRERRGE